VHAALAAPHSHGAAARGIDTRGVCPHGAPYSEPRLPIRRWDAAAVPASFGPSRRTVPHDATKPRSIHRHLDSETMRIAAILRGVR
jgi:hypothetical protein